MAANLKSVQTIYLTKIYFGDALHLLFPHERVASVQSWKDATRFHIEILFKDAPALKCEYDKEDLWLSLLRLIDEALSHLWIQ